MRAWLDANVEAVWATEWAAQSPVWDPELERMIKTLQGLTAALRQFRAESDKRFEREVSGALHRPRDRTALPP